MQSVLKIFSLCLFVVTLLFFLMILSDVHSFQDLKDLIAFKYLDIRVSFYEDKTGFSLFPYVISGFSFCILCAINSSWVSWNKTFPRVVASVLLFLIVLVFFFTPSLNYDPI